MSESVTNKANPNSAQPKPKSGKGRAKSKLPQVAPQPGKFPVPMQTLFTETNLPRDFLIDASECYATASTGYQVISFSFKSIVGTREDQLQQKDFTFATTAALVKANVEHAAKVDAKLDDYTGDMCNMRGQLPLFIQQAIDQIGQVKHEGIDHKLADATQWARRFYFAGAANLDKMDKNDVAALKLLRYYDKHYVYAQLVRERYFYDNYETFISQYIDGCGVKSIKHEGYDFTIQVTKKNFKPPGDKDGITGWLNKNAKMIQVTQGSVALAKKLEQEMYAKFEPLVNSLTAMETKIHGKVTGSVPENIVAEKFRENFVKVNLAFDKLKGKAKMSDYKEIDAYGTLAQFVTYNTTTQTYKSLYNVSSEEAAAGLMFKYNAQVIDEDLPFRYEWILREDVTIAAKEWIDATMIKKG